MIVFVEAGRRYMVAIVPVEVGHAGIISVVLDDLLLGDSEAVGVCEFAICQVNQFVDVFASQRCFSVVRCNRGSHLSKDHHVVFRHLLLFSWD